jgi:hypothetical protein
MAPPEDPRNEVACFAKQLIFRIAPEESEFFDEIETQFYLNPGPYKAPSAKDDPLQFGLHDELTTPAAIAATTVAFHYLLGIFSEVTKKVAIDVLKERLSGALRGDPSPLLTA